MQTLEERVEKIEERNRGVEMDKKWETSLTRQIILMIFSYLFIVIFFLVMGLQDPWINGIIAALAFMIQQLSMPFFRKIWAEMKK